MGENECTMDENYKLSVCVTCYNQIEYIEEAIDSILNQNFEYSYEILIGDDGSDDGSYELIRDKYGNREQVSVFRQARDSSIKEYANWRHARLIIRLMREVRGEYFALLDGDDYYCDMDGFRRKVNILDKPENQDCVICVSNMRRLHGDGGEDIAVHEMLPLKRDLQQCFLSLKPDPYLPVATGVIRSCIIRNIDERYTWDFNDTNIYFWLMNYGKRYYDDHITFTYRIHQGSIWSSSSQTLHSLRIVLDDDVANCQWHNKYRKALRRQHWAYYQDLYNSKKQLSGLIDYELWYPFAEEYHGWAYDIMCFYQKSMLEKFKLSIFVIIRYMLFRMWNILKRIRSFSCI